jgi:hypothetical protein
VSFQFLFLDVMTAVWVAIVFIAVFFWLPGLRGDRADKKPGDERLASSWTCMVLVSLVAVSSLSALRLFSWFSLVCFLGGYFLFSWWWRDRSKAIERLKTLFQNSIAALLDWLDRGLSVDFTKIISLSKQFAQNKLNLLNFIPTAIANNKLTFAAFSVILTFAILLRFEHPIWQLRLGNPENYSTLLTTRQILAREQLPFNQIPVISALAAVISLLGGIDAMQVVRFLSPLIGIVLVFSIGYTVLTLTQNRTAALAASFCIGAYLFTWQWGTPNLPNQWQQWLRVITDNLNAAQIRQWAGGDLELGATFALLAIARPRRPSIELFCRLVIVAIAATPLIIFPLLAVITLMAGRILTLAVVAIAWTVLGAIAALPDNPLPWGQSFLLTLPIGLSLLAGLLFFGIVQLLRLLIGKWADFACLTLIFAIAVNFFLPLPPSINYLEYDLAARKTLELRSLPLKSWAIAAPVEQLAQSYGAGWYEDLALFVDKYADDVTKPGFEFPYSVPHLFIFVEKKPFIASAFQFEKVPNILLTDPTYRYYRSAAGRSSLQYEALQLCEAYARTHSNISIDYEDNELRIYHILIPSSDR